MATIDMTRHQGSAGVALVELSSRKQQHYIVRTDIKAEQSDDGDIVSFIETKFPYKPTMAEIKEFVYAVINAQVRTEILSGFVWNGNPVWLSEENQMNWTQSVVPATFKIGEDSDGTPIYHTFTSHEEMKAFNEEWKAYIQQRLADGWAQKDGYDFTEYEQQLNAL